MLFSSNRPELASLIKHIRFEHVERLGTSGAEGTINRLNFLDLPLKTLFPSLKSLDLPICPWPYYSSKSSLPPWATNMEQLGRVLSTVGAKVHLSMGFESETAFSDRQPVAVEEKPPSKHKLAQLPELVRNL